MEELTFTNEASYRRYLKMADKIEADPALLDIPLADIARWLAQGQSAPHRLEQWRGIILAARETAEGMAALLCLMRDNSEEAQHLKSYSPMVGILTNQENQEARGNASTRTDPPGEGCGRGDSARAHHRPGFFVAAGHL